MDVLIIATNRHRHPMPVLPLGACLIAEATEKAGHQVRVLDLMFARHPVRLAAAEIRAFRPAVIGLSVRNIDNNDMAHPAFYPEELPSLLAAVRRVSAAPVVLGGAAVSVMPEELLRFTGATCAVCGEGEMVFPELLEGLAQGRLPKDLPGLAWLEDGVFQCNPPARIGYSRDCPAPDFRRWLHVASYRRQMATAPLQTKQGCHFRCVYCTYRKIEGGSYRMLEPASAAQAVRQLAAMGLRDIEVVDNVFNSPYHHAIAVCEELARLRSGARLQSLEINPAFVDDPLLEAMEQAGFTGIGLTVESAAAPVLRGLNKGFTTEAVYGAAEVISRHRLPCLWIFLLGGPGETPESVRETLTFARYAIRPGDVAFFNTGIRVYPGTELERIARQQGVLRCDRRQMLEPVFYVSPEVEPEWVRNEVKKAMADNLNFLDNDSIGLDVLPLLNGISRRLGLKPPLWRYSRHIRRGLRLLGMEA
jgi:radical SAM superfamily enzyme YgiQ (UPF0313 family)